MGNVSNYVELDRGIADKAVVRGRMRSDSAAAISDQIRCGTLAAAVGLSKRGQPISCEMIEGGVFFLEIGDKRFL